MKKVWLILLAVVLVFSMAFVGCKDKPDEPTGPGASFSFEGPFDYKTWGSAAPTIDGDWLVFDGVTSSTGFYVTFDSMGYTMNRTDSLIITYEVEITTPAVAFIVKQGTAMEDIDQGMTEYGQGKGREYVLGDDTLSVYDGPYESGTWDSAAKQGTFEVKMEKFKASANAIGFQHNVWCDMGGGGRIAEDSVYKLKFIKVENLVSDELLAPTITTQPAGARIPLGTEAADIAALTVVADDAPEGATRTYQWEKLVGETWTAISGATSATLAIATEIGNANAVGNWSFRVVVNNVRGDETASITSSIASIAVYDASTGPTWEDILAMNFFHKIWFDGNVITAESDGIKIVMTGGAIRVDVDGIRTTVGVPLRGDDDAEGHIVRLVYTLSDSEHTALDTSGQNGNTDRTTDIIYNINNPSAPPNDPWLRFTGGDDNIGTIKITDIQIAETEGWAGNAGVNESLKSIFEWLE